jgi:light-regulated signal transduction histidine kinase (bacteriophytochrome)
MGELIEGMLALSRVTRTEIRCTRVDLSALARAAADELQQREPGRAVEFVIAENLVVEADPRLVRTVLENLMGNAWKFTVGRPLARIEFGAMAGGRWPVAEVPSGGVAHQGSLIGDRNSERVFFVRDNGAGFDMAYVHKLYGVFQRLHSQEEFKGTGIGLATVQRIIQRHGGRTWAEGRVGEGATFYFAI